MSSLPNSLKQVALFFERLPGIGAKSASRMAFYLLRMPEPDLQEFANQIIQLKQRTKRCVVCMNLTESEICTICDDPARDRSKITVVEDVLDLVSFETGNIYDGVYHVLHGRIDPLNHIGPEDIFIETLLTRARPNGKAKSVEVQEVILATNPDMEGEATAMYIRNKLHEIKSEHSLTFEVSRLGYGMPIGGNLEYADYMTLRKAIENRSKFE